jgi:Lon protease-like protein
MTATVRITGKIHRKVILRAYQQPGRRLALAYSGSADRLADGPPLLPQHATCVEILSLDEHPDESLTVTVIGRQRIVPRLVREEEVRDPLGSTYSLLFVRNEPAPLERFDLNEEMITAWDTAEVFLKYTGEFYGAETRLKVGSSLPEDPRQLAAFLCTELSVGPATHQVLLDAGSLSECLKMVQTLTASCLAARAGATAETGIETRQ